MKLCLYGAGNTGKRFVERKIDWCIDRFSEIFFVDGNERLSGSYVKSFSVKNVESIDADTRIIITSVFWGEIYEKCCIQGYNVIGVYDNNSNEIISYKEMCKINYCEYKNDKYIRYLNEMECKIESRVRMFNQTRSIFKNLSEVAIMLSNLCNYADLHKKCPASCINEKEILPSKIVFHILDELASIKFDGTICFHIYNEPLIDPRLFWFIEYIRKNLPLTKVKIYSNGYYLNNQMVVELEAIGVDVLIVTGYGEAEFNRLLDLKVNIAYGVLYGRLDNRLDLYEESQKEASKEPCRTFFSQVCIYSNGDLGLCCVDYKHPYKLANLCESSLENALNKEQVIRLQKSLLSGDRTTSNICKNCTWSR